MLDYLEFLNILSLRKVFNDNDNELFIRQNRTRNITKAKNINNTYKKINNGTEDIMAASIPPPVIF